MSLARILDRLEKTFGRVTVPKRQKAFDMLVRLTSGYPASDPACERGYATLAEEVGTSAEAILAAPKRKLVKAMRAGGIVPEVRAERLRKIAARADDGADFSSRKVLESMPAVGAPGADRILLFTRIEPLAAVPSNALQVPVRIGIADEQSSYAATYRAAQKALDHELPRTYDARIRAYLLLKRHGQDVCKRSKPRCSACPLTRECRWFLQYARRP